MSGYEAARRAFDAYAGMDAPELPGCAWSSDQVRLARWQTKEFSYQPVWTAVAGISEEVCDELHKAVLAGDAEEIADACGDALVFATQLCTACRLDFGKVIRGTEQIVVSTLESAMAITGRLSHLALKHSQGIRGIDDETFRRGVCEAVGELWARLEHLLAMRGRSLAEVYSLTVETVLKRDWRANALTGAA